MSLRSLDLNLLKVFNEVMSERSLTKAAQKLAMTQPAVSNAIGRLRESLGDDLVVRSGYGVEPTAKAIALWPVVREALVSLETAISPGEFNPAQAAQSFRIAMADATATAIVPELVSIIEQEAPGVSLRILPLTTRDPRQLLESGKADVAIGYFPVAGPAIRLHLMQDDAADLFGVAPMYQGPYVCVMRKNHPLASSARITLDQFCAAHHLLVSFSGRPFGFADQSLAELGRKRRILLTVNQFFTAGLVVVKSDLLAVMPKHFIRSTGFEDQFAVRALPFKMDMASIDAIWTHRAEAEPAHQWLVSAIKRAINVSDDELLTRA